ncbi:hypothetical protein N657DRAFT_259989 [Parathielavia appendiculata]|uniref:Uncharacterized protein n=1 Tax=Parathielavia appendiculata TaxID=2587402 RepID=A0AAN6TSN1_9PEZI|nr:hypothetical protein N657DRAFT_259989 [Parathielavia appendiculata]
MLLRLIVQFLLPLALGAEPVASTPIAPFKFPTTTVSTLPATPQATQATRPSCGRNRPPMLYHTSEYYKAYKKTPYGWLGCNHNASTSEAFHAFALKYKDEPDRLRAYLRLAERLLDYSRSVGVGFQELIMALTRTPNGLGELKGVGSRVDPLGAAVVLFFQPPSVRCWLDQEILREIGSDVASNWESSCRLVSDQELLTRLGAESMIVRVVGQFKDALKRTLRAIEVRDEVFLSG